MAQRCELYGYRCIGEDMKKKYVRREKRVCFPTGFIYSLSLVPTSEHI